MSEPSNDEIKGFGDEPRAAFRIPKWLIAIALVIGLVAISLLILPRFLDQDRYKKTVIAKIQEMTGYDVSWSGKIDLALLPRPHITLHDAAASNGSQKILSIKQADIAIEAMPLLKGRVQIASVKLIEPDILLLVDRAGRQTWMTDRLSQSKDKAEKSNKAETSPATVTLDSVVIEKGRFVYRDERDGSQQGVSDLSLDLEAKSLAGPFTARSSFIYDRNRIEVNGNVGAIKDGDPAAVDVDFSAPDIKTEGSYKGVITTDSGFGLNGDLKLSVADLGDSIAALKEGETDLPDEIDGAVDLATAITFDGDKLDLSKLFLNLGKFVFSGNLGVNGLKTEAKPSLSIDLHSTSKSYSGSSLIGKLLSDIALKGRGGFANGMATIDTGSVTFDNQTVAFSGAATLPKAKGARPVVRLTVTAEKLDFDDLMEQLSPATESAAQKAVNARSGPGTAIAGFTLPFDGAVKARIGNLDFQGRDYSNLDLDMVSQGRTVRINSFSGSGPASSRLSLSGTVGDTVALSALDLSAALQTSSVEELARVYNLPVHLSQTLGAASARGRFNGSPDRLRFNATINALNFTAEGQGVAGYVLTDPVIDGLSLHLRHPSLQTAIRYFSPGFVAPGNFNGALNIATNLALKEKRYDLSAIKGQLGAVGVDGNASADLSGNKPQVSGDLSLGNIIFDPSSPVISSSGGGGKSGGNGARWSREAIDTSWMTALDADLKIRASSITKDLYRLTNPVFAFRLADGALTVGNLHAGIFGGTVALTGHMKSGTAKSPLSMDWQANAKQIDARQMLSAFQNKQTDTLSGTIQNFDANISSAGNSPAALIYALNGRGHADGRNVVVKGVDAAKLAATAKGSFKPLERAGSLLNSFQDGQTAFETFNAEFTIQSGIMNFSEIRFDGAQALLVSNGNVDLPRWTVNLKNTMTVKNSDIPPFDFTISGPLDHPVQAGGSIIENYLREKAQAKIQKVIEKQLEKTLGIPSGLLNGSQAPATPQTAADPATPEANVPAGDAVAPAKTKEEQQVEQIQEGVKALKGLFGK